MLNPLFSMSSSFSNFLFKLLFASHIGFSFSHLGGLHCFGILFLGVEDFFEWFVYLMMLTGGYCYHPVQMIWFMQSHMTSSALVLI